MSVCEGNKPAQSEFRTMRTAKKFGKTYVDQCLSVYSSHGHPIIFHTLPGIKPVDIVATLAT